MSLWVFNNYREAAEAGFDKVVELHNYVFRQNGYILDNDIARFILFYMEEGKYVNENTFESKEGILLSIGELGYDTRRVLNVVNNPGLCFNMESLSNEGMAVLPLLHEGNIVWGEVVINPTVLNEYQSDCDIVYKGYHFSNVESLINFLVWWNEEMGYVGKGSKVFAFATPVFKCGKF